MRPGWTRRGRVLVHELGEMRETGATWEGRCGELRVTGTRAEVEAWVEAGGCWARGFVAAGKRSGA